MLTSLIVQVLPFAVAPVTVYCYSQIISSTHSSTSENTHSATVSTGTKGVAPTTRGGRSGYLNVAILMQGLVSIASSNFQ